MQIIAILRPNCRGEVKRIPQTSMPPKIPPLTHMPPVNHTGLNVMNFPTRIHRRLTMSIEDRIASLAWTTRSQLAQWLQQCVQV